jgi:hypothetical protein
LIFFALSPLAMRWALPRVLTEPGPEGNDAGHDPAAALEQERCDLIAYSNSKPKP